MSTKREACGAKISGGRVMLREWRWITAILVVLALGTPALGQAQSSQPAQSSEYSWHGELVSVDATAMKVTVKSRVAYQDAVSALNQFKPGDSVWVVWSGVHDYSDAVRQVRRVEAGRKIDENLVLPAELVSTEAPNQYITIRVKVPESSLAAIKATKPGEWVIVTSRHRPSTDAEAVIAVRPYGSSTSTT
jgi:hypothetical protein